MMEPPAHGRRGFEIGGATFPLPRSRDALTRAFVRSKRAQKGSVAWGGTRTGLAGPRGVRTARKSTRARTVRAWRGEDDPELVVRHDVEVRGEDGIRNTCANKDRRMQVAGGGWRDGAVGLSTGPNWTRGAGSHALAASTPKTVRVASTTPARARGPERWKDVRGCEVARSCSQGRARTGAGDPARRATRPSVGNRAGTRRGATHARRRARRPRRSRPLGGRGRPPRCT